MHDDDVSSFSVTLFRAFTNQDKEGNYLLVVVVKSVVMQCMTNARQIRIRSTFHNEQNHENVET